MATRDELANQLVDSMKKGSLINNTRAYLRTQLLDSLLKKGGESRGFTIEQMVCNNLILEYMQMTRFPFSTSVFAAESVSNTANTMQREDLMKYLKIKSIPSIDTSLLEQALHTAIISQNNVSIQTDKIVTVEDQLQAIDTQGNQRDFSNYQGNLLQKVSEIEMNIKKWYDTTLQEELERYKTLELMKVENQLKKEYSQSLKLEKANVEKEYQQRLSDMQLKVVEVEDLKNELLHVKEKSKYEERQRIYLDIQGYEKQIRNLQQKNDTMSMQLNNFKESMVMKEDNLKKLRESIDKRRMAMEVEEEQMYETIRKRVLLEMGKDKQLIQEERQFLELEKQKINLELQNLNNMNDYSEFIETNNQLKAKLINTMEDKHNSEKTIVKLKHRIGELDDALLLKEKETATRIELLEDENAKLRKRLSRNQAESERKSMERSLKSNIMELRRENQTLMTQNAALRDEFETKITVMTDDRDRIFSEREKFKETCINLERVVDELKHVGSVAVLNSAKSAPQQFLNFVDRSSKSVSPVLEKMQEYPSPIFVTPATGKQRESSNKGTVEVLSQGTYRNMDWKQEKVDIKVPFETPKEIVRPLETTQLVQIESPKFDSPESKDSTPEKPPAVNLWALQTTAPPVKKDTPKEETTNSASKLAVKSHGGFSSSSEEDGSFEEVEFNAFSD
ncbi:hypothetical protein PCE1_000020 [Barthelona sp. PCE]